MRCALFGKLPSKRDFVSLGMERPFLDLWENWLQTGVAISHEVMGPAWQEAFLAAPIWRFWLGPQIAGTTTTGAVMPSVDKVGRYFPLSLSAAAPQGSRLAPPPDEGLDTWHAAAEQFLLRMLEDELGGELTNLLAEMPIPRTTTNIKITPPVLEGEVMTAPNGHLDVLFASLLTEDQDALFSARSYWWTHGGPAHAPQLLVTRGMPSPALFSTMLSTGTTVALE